MKLHTFIKTVPLLSMILLTSCASTISSDVYTASHVGEASITYVGVIKSVRNVIVQEGDRLENNSTGILSGGVLGAGAGSAIGQGNFLASAAGAVAGAVAGSLLEKKLKEQSAVEYVVEIDNGSLMTVVQGSDQRFEIGQPVFLVVGQSGRSRIVSR